MAYVLRNVLNGDRQAHDHGDGPGRARQADNQALSRSPVTGLWRPGWHRQGGVRVKGNRHVADAPVPPPAAGGPHGRGSRLRAGSRWAGWGGWSGDATSGWGWIGLARSPRASAWPPG